MAKKIRQISTVQPMANQFAFTCRRSDLEAIIKRLLRAKSKKLQLIVRNNECRLFCMNGYEEVLPVSSLIGEGIVGCSLKRFKELLPLLNEEVSFSLADKILRIDSMLIPLN